MLPFEIELPVLCYLLSTCWAFWLIMNKHKQKTQPLCWISNVGAIFHSGHLCIPCLSSSLGARVRSEIPFPFVIYFETLCRENARSPGRNPVFYSYLDPPQPTNSSLSVFIAGWGWYVTGTQLIFSDAPNWCVIIYLNPVQPLKHFAYSVLWRHPLQSFIAALRKKRS